MLLSIVVPVYNEEENIAIFYEAVTDVMSGLTYDYELIYVDDGSSDSSSMILREIAYNDKHVKVLLLARNFGHQTALTCGLDYAHGDAVITMDGDMQHPPALIPELVRLWESGYDVVRTIRDSTEDASWAKSFTSKYYYKLMNKMADVPIVEGGSDFRLMNSKALGTLKRFREHGRFLRGIVGALGYRQAELHFVAPPRFAGVSKFSVRKMIRFALDGVTAFSRVPLRAALYVGVLCGGMSFLLILHLLYVYITGQALNGWTTLGVSILFIGGIQLVGLGIIGEYVGRIFEEVKQRPLYWVKSAINFEETYFKSLERKHMKSKYSKVKITALTLTFVCATTAMVGATTLQYGDKGKSVTAVQQQLIKHGYNATDKNGVYGKETKWAVRLFQQDRGLPVDGIVGPATYNALMGAPRSTKAVLTQNAATKAVATKSALDEQYNVGVEVSRANLKAGDLVFFETYEPGPSHSGIYIGDGKFISATSSRGVAVADLDTGYWGERYIGAKRVVR